MKIKLVEFINGSKKPLLLDGAMGTQLAEFGLAPGGQNCVTNPDAVIEVHKKYVNSGVNILITNTLTMNRVYLETHKVNIDVNKVNIAGVKLAKEAAKDQYVLGDISTTGKLLKPTGKLEEEDAYRSFKEQAGILAEAGADGLIIETMIDLREAVIAVKACREAFDIPVIASMSFDTLKNGIGRTVMGNKAADCAKALADAGAFAVGANCGSLDPYQVAEIVAEMKKAVIVPIIAQPNAGRPRLENKKVFYDMTPEEYAKGLMICVEAGAKLIGGCCGTSPAHIKAAADMLKNI
jgi:5-methyltetrahydrofolate--homocysteine methyltransferase